MTLKEFPNSQNEPFEETSPETDQYNCLAWVMHDTQRWWDTEDEDFWVSNLPQDSTLKTLVLLGEKQGFVVCDNGQLEKGYEKMALFSLEGTYCTHVARQLASGQWTSKLGTSYDVTHSLKAMEGGIYGNVVQFLKKAMKA